MKEKVPVSVIIPVYNAEKTVGESLKDIVNQSLQDIEIICVDDGSNDGSVAIIKEFMEKDKRILLFEQQNQYAGVARNTGLERASGKYVVFFDADDRFDGMMLERLYNKAEAEHADIAVCDIKKWDDQTEKYVLPSNYLRKEFLPEKIPFSVKENPQYIFNFTTSIPWNKIYRREFVKKNQLYFEKRKRANDVFFVLQALYLAERISIVDERLATYRYNNSESLTGTLADEVFSTYDAYLSVHDALKERGAFKDENVLQSFANKALNMMIQSIDLQKNEENLKTLFHMLLEEGFKKLDIEDHGEEYYYSRKVHQVYHTMLQGSMIDTLIVQKQQKEENLEAHRQRLCHQKQKNIELKEKLKNTKQELKNVNSNLGVRALKKCRLIKE